MTTERTPPAPVTGEVPIRVGRLAELGVLTSSLLHELRQPLFAIKSLVELEVVAAREPASEARERRMRTILSQVEHLERLIGHYGSMGRDDDDAVRLDVAEQAQTAVDMLAHRARQVGATLRWTADGPAWVHARASAIRQLVLNLVQNALDAVEGGTNREVEVSLTLTASTVQVDVRDTGAGIDAAIAGSLFEPFVTTKPMSRGTGLGLYISRSLARELGGDVAIAGTAPSGTTMRLELPRLT